MKRLIFLIAILSTFFLVSCEEENSDKKTGTQEVSPQKTSEGSSSSGSS